MITTLLSPLVEPECCRLLSRRWIFVARGVMGGVGVSIVLIWLWICWFAGQLNASEVAFGVSNAALISTEVVLLIVALLFSPALLAGTFAEEKDRGTLALLLTSLLSNREIVTGRFVGRLAQISIILLAALPALVLLAAVQGVSLAGFAVLVLLPMAVAVGSGGLALLASVMARRARDALVSVYLLELLGVVSPLLGSVWLRAELMAWIGPLNPFYGLSALVEEGNARPGFFSMALWTALGLVSIALASWRLRPTYVKQISRGAVRLSTWAGCRKTPGINELNPMLWKELYIERSFSLGRVGRWLGGIIVVGMLGLSVGSAGVLAWNVWVQPNPMIADGTIDLLSVWTSATALPVSWLLQWGLGLRAAAAIAAERERGTWDALLTSPLEGDQIVWPKVWGSLYALRGIVVAVVLAWTLAALCGAMEAKDYLTRLANTVVIGWFMAAAGVAGSLFTSTVTRAMTWTIAVWMVAAVVVGAVAGFVAAIGALVISMVSLFLWAQNGSVGQPFIPFSFETSWTLIRLAIYALQGLAIVAFTRRRFDTITGRQASRPLRMRR